MIILFLTVKISIRWRNIQISHAKWPLNLAKGKSTTALFLPTVAIVPKSWYSYSVQLLFLKIFLRFWLSNLAWFIATLASKEVTEKIAFGSESYSLEELTAEIGACFLKSFSGLPMDDLSQNASYIQNWLEVLKNDKRFIVKTSSWAQRAVEYIMNNTVETDTPPMTKDDTITDEMAIELVDELCV